MSIWIEALAANGAGPRPFEWRVGHRALVTEPGSEPLQSVGRGCRFACTRATSCAVRQGSTGMSVKPRLRAAPAMLVFLAVIVGLAVALTPSLAPATLPGKNGRISFARFVERTDSLEIFTAEPNGADVQRLT